MPTTTAPVTSAARFVLDLPSSIGQTAFSELVTISSADDSSKTTFSIRNAWCRELTVDGMSAGSSSVVVLQVTIACDAVEVL